MKTRENAAVLDFLAFDNFDFPRKIVKKFGWKTRENVVVLRFLVVDNFDFPRKIVELNFGQKFDFSNSVQLLTKTYKASNSSIWPELPFFRQSRSLSVKIVKFLFL